MREYEPSQPERMSPRAIRAYEDELELHARNAIALGVPVEDVSRICGIDFSHTPDAVEEERARAAAREFVEEQLGDIYLVEKSEQPSTLQTPRLSELSEDQLVEFIKEPITPEAVRAELSRRLGERGLAFTEFYGDEGTGVHIYREGEQ